MKARLLFQDKFIFEDGAIREMIIWQLPKADDERLHRLKYRLYYGFPGRCLIRYDNEKGKGDHYHFGTEELIYGWVSVEKLIADFMRDIALLRGNENG